MSKTKTDPLRMVELQQRAENGGFPTANEDRKFGHGEAVLVVSKLELKELLERANRLIAAMMPGVRHIALQDYQELNEVPITIERTLRTIET